MTRSKKHAEFVLVTVFVDIIAIIASFVMAYALRFTTGYIPIKGEAPEFEHYFQVLVVVIPVYLWFFRAYGLYKSSRTTRRIEEIFTLLKAITFSIVILTALTFFYRGFFYSRIYLVTVWIFSMGIISAARYFLIQWEYQRKRQKKEIQKVLIAGANRNARSIIKWAQDNPHYGHEIIGVLAHDKSLVGKHVEGIPVLGITDQCESFVAALKPDRLVLVDSSFSRERITDLVDLCEDRWIDFKIAADFYGLMSQAVDVEYVSRVPLLGFKSLPLDDIWNRLAKRTFDFFSTAILTVFLSPLLLIVAAMIKCDDGGPLFYLQERVGRDEKRFKLVKFRTMKVDAEKETGPVWARKDDERRTRIGNFLRKWNIDELPQLFNVLRGDMSLVGPRPERPHFVNQFRENVPRYISRHKIKSGITGWAQVNGFRGNTSIEERIKYDLYYMENWSLILDIEILFMTVFTAKGYTNAY